MTEIEFLTYIEPGKHTRGGKVRLVVEDIRDGEELGQCIADAEAMLRNVLPASPLRVIRAEHVRT